MSMLPSTRYCYIVITILQTFGTGFTTINFEITFNGVERNLKVTNDITIEHNNCHKTNR